jgi:membrane protease YdiL (CAAX protease family)
MTMKKASLCLSSLFLAVFLFDQAFVQVKPLLEPITHMGYLMMNKSIFALGLLIFVYGSKIQRQCGLFLKANWRTLPIYWPIALIAVLTLTSGINTDTSASMMTVLVLAIAAGIFVEELMFRGLVFYWFREASVRKQILISGLAFGGLHLLGLFSGIEPGVILAQAYLAAGFGIIFGYARARDYSIMIPILVHFTFNLITLGSKGGVMEAASTAPVEQMVIGMVAAGTVPWAWGVYLLWKAGKNKTFASLSSNISSA